VDAGDVEVPRNTSDVNRSMSDSDGGSGEDYLTMPGEGGSEGKNNDGPTKKKGEEPPKKRRKTGEEGDAIDVDNELNGVEKNSSDDDSSSEHESEGASGAELKTKAKGKRPYVKLTQKQQDQLDFAKNKLSKWAARLFDPNRPRGLVEAPAVIPLNDEFLTAFGKRERDYDELTGREVEIDKTSLDVIDVSDGDDENENSNQKTTDGKGTKNFSEMAKCKVKISNLSYKTTTATIVRNFGSIGSVVDVNLILNDNGQSSGRAYVVFEDHESALSCVGKMNEKQMEGRTLYISLASASSSGRKSLNGPKKPDSRYWERDISTKCNCCGEVGHIAKNCPNEQKLKPCGLCAKLGHDSWSCPEKSVCFNCGLPGHVVRDCNQRRGLPQRCVCTICYRSGHSRFQCRELPWNAPSQDAICMQCGKKGHLMCSEMRWFFGLKGVSCFNCGQKDHSGFHCRRPNVDECQKNSDLAQREINMAGAVSLTDQLSNQRSSRESRDRRPHSNDNSRARSNPPPRNRGNDRDDYSRQGSNSRDSRWQEPPPQRAHQRF